MIDDPIAFAAQWCEAWNAGDLDRLLAHFHEDVVFTSPMAAKLVPASSGRVVGKAALGEYWAKGLSLIPDLHFTVEQVFAGVDAIVIQYRNQKGIQVSEVLIFEGGLVRYGAGTYPVEAALDG